METQIKSLLNLDEIIKKDNDNKVLDLKSLAESIMNEVCIFNGVHSYHPIEIEFYIYDKEHHADILVYPRDNKKAGDIFFHQSGIDICFNSSIKDGRFGGILIRSVEREDGKQFGGPLISKDEILNSAIQKCIVQESPKGFMNKISKITQRKGFKGPKGSKDIYWNKEYRFVSDNVKKPITRTEQQLDPDTGEIINKDIKCYL